MDRQTLIQEVKGQYASLASQESQRHFSQTTNQITPEAYYEQLLSMVIHEIESGTFDSFQSGEAIVDAVSKDKQSWLTQWNEASR